MKHKQRVAGVLDEDTGGVLRPIRLLLESYTLMVPQIGTQGLRKRNRVGSEKRQHPGLSIISIPNSPGHTQLTGSCPGILERRAHKVSAPGRQGAKARTEYAHNPPSTRAHPGGCKPVWLSNASRQSTHLRGHAQRPFLWLPFPGLSVMPRLTLPHLPFPTSPPVSFLLYFFSLLFCSYFPFSFLSISFFPINVHYSEIINS